MLKFKDKQSLDKGNYTSEELQSPFEPDQASKQEAHLWNEFKSGNKSAFANIYKTYAFILYNYGRQVSADEELVKDCIQDLFVELWKNKQNLGSTNSIKYYLFKSLRRKMVYQETCKKKRFDNLNDLKDDYQLVLPYESSLIATQITDQRKDNLLKAINALSVRQREVIFLIFYDNLSYAEAASIMSINLRSVYTITWKALEVLRKSITKISFF